MKDKMKNSKGFTLLEMTITLLTVTLVTSLFFVMVSLVKNVYIEMEETAESQVLCSTLTNAIQDELRYASVVSPNADGSFTYYSESLGIGDGCKIVNVKVDGKNLIAVEKGGKNYYFVSSKSYIHNLEADVNARFVEKNSNGVPAFYVTIKIYDYKKRVDANPFIESTFEVIPLNQNGLISNASQMYAIISSNK